MSEAAFNAGDLLGSARLNPFGYEPIRFPRYSLVQPSCFDRPPFTGYWTPVRPKIGDHKPRWRWVEQRMSQRCAAWDAPDIRDSVPARERWDCRGCRWLPVAAEQFTAASARLRRALEIAFADDFPL